MHRASQTKRQGDPIRGRLISASGGSGAWVSYDSVGAAATKLGLSRNAVSHRLSGYRLNPRGYEFEKVAVPNLPGKKWVTLIVDGAEVVVPSKQRYESQSGVRYAPVVSAAPGKSYASVKIKGSTYSFHKLVACVFLQPPSDSAKTQVNHRDGNKSNNDPSNLEWCTPSENVLHSYDISIFPDRWLPSGTTKSGATRSKAVLARQIGSRTWIRYNSAGQAAKGLGVSNQGLISKCCNGKRAQASGYEFKFEGFKPKRREVYHTIVLTTEGLSCPEMQRSMTWEEFMPSVVPRMTGSASGKRKRSGGAASVDELEQEEMRQIEDELDEAATRVVGNRATRAQRRHVQCEDDDDEWHHTNMDSW